MDRRNESPSREPHALGRATAPSGDAMCASHEAAVPDAAMHGVSGQAAASVCSGCGGTIEGNERAWVRAHVCSAEDPPGGQG